MKSAMVHSLRHAFARSAERFDPGRRSFLRNTMITAAALSMPMGGCSLFRRNPSIAIVGAGIAGLTAAYELKKLHLESTLYEATGRAGGRVLTVDDAVVDGAYVDFGAEYVDGTHTAMLELSKELEVDLIDLRNDPLIARYYFFEGQKFSEEDLVDALQPFAGRMIRDIESLPAELHYSKADKFQALDSKTVAEYLKDLEVRGWLYAFFDAAMKSEYAMDITEQSALNLLTILATPIVNSEHYHVFGNEHEVFKIRGGTQRLVDKLYAQVKTRIKTGWQLTAIHQAGQRYQLIFNAEGKKETIDADHIILAIPFTVLRSIETDFKFPERKQRCIEKMGFGNAAKVAMGFKKRVWREQGFQGYAFTDVNETTVWDSSMGVDIPAGSLTFVTGGEESADVQHLHYPNIIDRWLGGAEKLYPGLTEEFNGRISKFCWQTHPFSNGSYTSYKRGQWSDFAGVEQEPFGNIHFAGEHCSVRYQGFMNGAVESGKRAAMEITAPPPLLMPREKGGRSAV